MIDTTEISACLRHLGRNPELSDEEMDKAAWGASQGYSPEFIAFAIDGHRVYGTWEMPVIVGEDDA